MSKKILVLPGDGIGPEIIAQGVKVLETAAEKFGIELVLDYFDGMGSPLRPHSACEAPTTASSGRSSSSSASTRSCSRRAPIHITFEWLNMFAGTRHSFLPPDFGEHPTAGWTRSGAVSWMSSRVRGSANSPTPRCWRAAASGIERQSGVPAR